MQGTQKIVNLGLLCAGIGVFVFLMNLVKSIWGLASLPRITDWIITPPIFISFVVTAGAIIYARRHEKANRFLNEVTVELSKVTWPNRKDTSISTGISCVLVAICALILFFFDSLWGTIMRGMF